MVDISQGAPKGELPSTETKDHSFYYTPKEVCTFSEEEVGQIWTEQFNDFAEWVTVDNLGNVVPEGIEPEDIKPEDIKPLEIPPDESAANEKLKKIFSHIVLHRHNDKDDYSDIDGETAKMLLVMAGLTSNKKDKKTGKYIDITFINKGDNVIPGLTHIDCGVKKNGAGVVKLENKDTPFYDHHDQEGGEITSAAALILAEIMKSNLYQQNLYKAIQDKYKIEVDDAKKALEKFISLVTEKDNLGYPISEEAFNKSDKTMYGLLGQVKPETLLQFCVDGGNPAATMNDKTELDKYGLDNPPEIVKNADGTEKTVIKSISAKRRLLIDIANAYFNENEPKGYVAQSLDPKFGKVLIDYGAKFSGVGGEFAIAKGCDTYLIWNDDTQSFFISCKNGLPEDFNPGEGIKIRGVMWVSERGAPLRISLAELLKMMRVAPEGELAKRAEEEAAIEFKNRFEQTHTRVGTIKDKFNDFDERINQYNIDHDYSGNEDNIDDNDSIYVAVGNQIFCFSHLETVKGKSGTQIIFRPINPETGKLTETKFHWKLKYMHGLDYPWYLKKVNTLNPPPVDLVPPVDQLPEILASPLTDISDEQLILPNSLPAEQSTAYHLPPMEPESILLPEDRKPAEQSLTLPELSIPPEPLPDEEIQQQPAAALGVDSSIFQDPNQPTTGSPAIIPEEGLDGTNEVPELVETINGYKILLPDKNIYVAFRADTRWQIPINDSLPAKIYNVEIVKIAPLMQEDAKSDLNSFIEVSAIISYTNDKNELVAFSQRFTKYNLKWWRDLLAKSLDIDDHIIPVEKK